MLSVTGQRLATTAPPHATHRHTTSRPHPACTCRAHAAGLRSFTQLASMAEPATGSLRQDAVRDLARRASQLDLARAVGQVLVSTGRCCRTVRTLLRAEPVGAQGTCSRRCQSHVEAV